MGRSLASLCLMLSVCGMTAGCATPSGQALQRWLGNSVDRMRRATDPDRWVTPEIRRARRLMAKAPGYATQEFHRTTPLARATVRQARDVRARALQLPRKVVKAVDRDLTDMKYRTQHLVAPNSLLRQTLDPGRYAQAVRRIWQRLPTVLGLDRPLLSGPGDPDRQTGAHPTGRQRTFVEKILRRVPL